MQDSSSSIFDCTILELEMSLFFLLLFLFFPSMTISSFDDFNSFVYVGCSQNRYTLGSPYQLNVDSLLTSLANPATFSSYHDFTSNAAAATPAYGLFQCRTDLPTSDCATCVRSALDKLPSLCPYATFAAVQLKGCFVRYSNDSFIGNPDTALVYKKCGGSGSEMVGLRDAALGGLGGGGTGEYRVGAAGRVRALAQCVGDQGARECSECVAAAVEQVNDACGAANAGNVYLGKCYVSYWSGGAYDSDRSSHYHGDHVSAKTLAIVLAVTVAVVIGIVIFSIMRRNGK